MSSRLPFAMSFLFLVAGCDIPLWGNGHPVTRERDIASFTGIEVSTAIDVDLEVGASETAERIPPDGTPARLRCDSNLVDRIETRVVDGVLHVSAQDDGEDLRPRSTCELVLTTGRLEAIEVSGPGTIVAHGRLDGLRRIDAEGPAEVSADEIDAEELVVRVEGPAELALAGVVEHLDADIEGPAELDAESLAARSVDLVAEGPVEASVRASESCSLAIEGPAEIDVYGHPDDRDVDAEGPVEIRFR